MKKPFLLLVGLSLLFFLSTTQARAVGEECKNLGGVCRTVCFSGENDLGAKDCPQAGVTGGRTCCVPTVSPKPGEEGGTAAGFQPEKCNEGTENEGIKTALGCIPVKDTTSFVAWFLRWAIGIAGGIAFLLILFAGFQIMTSSGDPEKLKAGKELLTSAIAGLILIIFSVFLLRLIGVEILRIPGF